MELDLNFNELLLLIGLFLSIIMAVAVGIKAKKQLANVWFVGFLLSSAVVFAVKFLYSTGQIINYPHWFKLNYPAGLLRPLFFYLYVYFLLNRNLKFRLIHLLHFVPFIILLSYLFPFIIQDANYKTDVLNRSLINTLGILPSWYTIFQFLYSIVYLGLVYLSLRVFVKTNPRPNRKKKVLIKWIQLILVASVIFMIVAVFLRVAGLSGEFNLYLYEVYSILLILLCIRLMTLPEMTSFNTNNKYERSSLSKQDMIDYFSEIKILMEKKHLYKRKDLKLIHISEKLNIPEYLISQIVNQESGKSFKDFINQYRIEEAKKILLNSHHKFTIEGIAHDAGFQSRASFYSAFKKYTHLTPSQYLEMAK